MSRFLCMHSGSLLRCFTEIDFEEFLAIYKRIIILSKSTVGQHVNDITWQPPKLVAARQYKARLLSVYDGLCSDWQNLTPSRNDTFNRSQNKIVTSDCVPHPVQPPMP